MFLDQTTKGTLVVPFGGGLATTLVGTQIGYHLGADMVPRGYRVGTTWGQGWYHVGTGLVPCGYRLGTTWVQGWYHVGTGLVPCGYRLGTAWGQGWYHVGTGLVPRSPNIINEFTPYATKKHSSKL